ncbi:hypothetical protein HCQ94_05140 [Actinomyces sp. zg-332]|uniref:MSCRAMM family protein n=1 Tax=Actinomyces sp. zg-332 TaxID=2708340 RepID=UPI00142344B1|nr:SpaA isopeptide-forming pilin-related protein [Actinomyces sp. zg-332]QPK93957.1 hypothetical protein HCQ94_05140 [Actinomyces sp. zg-332]
MRKILSVLLILALGVITYITPAYASNSNDTLKVDIKIINLEGDNSTNDRSEYWVNENINAAADINVSGEGASLSEPWARITVPKLGGKIKKPQFVDSEKAYQTTYTEDENNWYVTYKFKELSGGNRLTFPFPFIFNEDPTRNGDSVDTKFEILDGNSSDPKNVLYSATKTYTAKKQEVEYNDSKLRFSYVSSSLDPATKLPYESFIATASQNDTGSTERTRNLHAISFYNLPPGTPDNVSYITPKNIKTIITIPEGITFDTKKNPDWTYDENTRTASLISTDVKRKSRSFGDGRIEGYIAEPTITFKNTPFGTYTVSARYIVDSGLETERELPSRDFKFAVTRIIYFPSGNAYIYKYGDAPGSPVYDYTYADNKYYAGGKPYDDMVYKGTFAMYNNGSSPTDSTNGIVTNLYKITDTLDDERVHYTGFKINFDYSDVKENKTEWIEEHKARFNAANFKLYGVKDNGDRVLVASNVQMDTRVDVNDPNREFVKLELESDQPFKMDNIYGKTYTYIAINDKDKSKWDNGEYTSSQRITSGIEATVKIAKESDMDTAKLTVLKDLYKKNHAYLDVDSIQPRATISGSADTTVVYKKSGSRTGYLLRGLFDRGGWGPLNKVENVKYVTLLPPGVEYVRRTSVSPSSLTPPAPTVIPNYKNTGKTAVITELGDLDFSVLKTREIDARYELELTINASRGNNEIENYITYDNNDLVKPLTDSYGKADNLDLDGDGDRDEVFLARSSNINFIPPLELIVTKEVSNTKDNFSFISDIDLDSEFFYRIKINNNTIAAAPVADVIDVLPYVGDHAIVANDTGEYKERGSAFAVALSNSVESVPENAEALELYDVFYQLTPQGADLESVRDGAWVSAADVPNGDFSTVKSIKFTLKSGKRIASKQEVRIIIPARMPSDKSLSEKDFAHNTSALSTDRRLYSEGNKTSVAPNKYSISGTYFKDLNGDGVIGDTEDKVAGRQVELIDATTGNVATDIDGRPIPSVTTGENGKYSFTVYKQGEYIVRFAKENTETFTSVNNKKPKNSNIETSADNHGDSYRVTLSPSITDIIANAGLYSDKRDVVISKVSSVAGENGIKPGLENVEFKLYSVADDSLVATATTNEVGRAVFANIPFGEYKIVESRPLPGYEVLEPNGRVINLTNGDFPIQIFENTPIKGTVTVTKTDSDTHEAIGGVEFVLKQNDKEIVAATTNDEGIATFNDVAFGEYTLVEKAPKTGYAASTRTETVNIDRNGKRVEISNWTNTKAKGTVTVTKTDSDTREVIAGVEFALKQGGQEVTSVTTGQDGVATFSNLVYGEYTLVEKAPKTGYVASTRTETVNIDADGKSVAFADWKNTKIKGSVSVLKHDGDSNSPLAGVVFALKQGDVEVATATTGQDGVATFSNVVYGDYTVVEKTALVSHVLNTETVYNANVRNDGENVFVNETAPFLNYIKKGTVTVTKTDSDTNSLIANVVFALKQGENEVATATTDAQGIATFSNVKYGEYTLVEKTPVEGYVASTRSETVNIDSNGKSVAFADWKNTKIKGSIAVTKTDSDTHEAIAGVKFVLKQNGQEVATATTSQDGVATFSDVVYGEYTLVEKTPVEGYVASTRTEAVNIDTNGKSVAFDNWTNTKIKGTVTVTKTDSDSNEAIAGVVFALKQNGQEVATATTGQDGVATFSDVVYGEYTLVEKTPAEGYVASTRTEAVNIDTNGKSVAFADWKNTKIKGTVTVTKSDSDDSNVKLEGVVFALKQGEREIATATTDAQGVATFSNVNYGEYTLVEKTPAEGYVASTRTETVNIDADGKSVAFADWTNTKIKGSVSVLKHDGDTNLPLAGVVFALMQNNTEIATATTNDEGIATFSNVVFGAYTVVEKSTLASHVLNADTTYNANIRTNGENVFVNETAPFLNYIKKGTVTVAKADSDTNGPIANVVFALKQNGQEVATATTGQDGVATFSNVKYGEYTLVEKTPVEGYVASTRTETVNITADGQNVVFDNWTNTKIKGTVTVTKTDADSHEAISGVVFVLKQNDNEVATTTTGQDGVATFSNVVYGEYTLVEKAPKVGYVASTRTETVNITADGQSVAFADWTNTKIKGTVTVTKTDSDSNEAISGVVFALKQGDVEVATATTGQDGVATFSDVVYGDYTLLEKTPAEGYVASTRSETVNIESNGQSVEFSDWTNTKIKGSVSVLKHDGDTNLPLAGVVFALKQGDKEVATATTNDDGIATFSNVVFGAYTVVEKSTLASHVLNADTTYNANIRTNGENVFVNENDPLLNYAKKGTVTVTKTDSDSNEAISGVVFALKQGDVEVATATTGQDGVATFSDVVYGEYTLVEKTPAEGYVASTRSETVNIESNGQSVEFSDWTNTKIKGSVVVSVTDKVTGAPISGALIELREKGTSKVISKGKTTASGKVTFVDVPYGEYEVVQVASTGTYVFSTDPVSVSIIEDGRVVEVAITNTRRVELKKVPRKRLVNTGVDTSALYLMVVFGILGFGLAVPRKKQSE